MQKIKKQQEFEHKEHELNQSLVHCELRRLEVLTNNELLIVKAPTLVGYIQRQVPIFSQFEKFQIKYQPRGYTPLTGSTLFDCMKDKNNMSIIIQTTKTLIVTYSPDIIPSLISKPFFELKDFCIYELEKNGKPVLNKWLTNSSKNYGFIAADPHKLLLLYNAFTLKSDTIEYTSKKLKSEDGMIGQLGETILKEMVKRVLIVQWLNN